MFYEFNQNNSGGSFTFDKKRGITHYVIIEADSSDEANSKAETIGLYFDGDGDCPCCGDRWYASSASDGHEVPSHYGIPLPKVMKELYSKHGPWGWMDDGREFVVHYKDGTMKWFDKTGKPATKKQLENKTKEKKKT